MNRQEQRGIEWGKKDHNRLYKDAAACWKEMNSVDAVALLLLERGFDSDKTQGYLIEYRGLSLSEAENVVLRAQANSFGFVEGEQ
jgi:hypothetical protein